MEITTLLNNAICYLLKLGLEPKLINLSTEDYKKLVMEADLFFKEGIDYCDNETKKLQYYNGIEICSMLLDSDEVINELYSESYISTLNVLKQINVRGLEYLKYGRCFNIRSLEEII